MGDGAIVGHTHSASAAPLLFGNSNKTLLLDDMGYDERAFLFAKAGQADLEAVVKLLLQKKVIGVQRLKVTHSRLLKMLQALLPGYVVA